MKKVLKRLRAATAVGADGLILEVHNDPAHALCDGAQSLTPEAFADVAQCVKAVRGLTAPMLPAAAGKRP